MLAPETLAFRTDAALRVVWPVDALQQPLAALRPGLRVEAVAEVDSTNTRLLERARAGDRSPWLLVAERQTAGRGRLGRLWWSDTVDAHGAGPGSLTFSIGVTLSPRGPVGWSGLSLAIGVALAGSLNERLNERLNGTDARVMIKWPNDLWLQREPSSLGRKLGGVLIETLATANAGEGGRHAIIGIGINLDAPPARAGIGQPVAGWREVESQASAPALLGRVAPAVMQALSEFERDGFAAFAARFARHDALAGLEVHTLSEPRLKGRADGVDARGALRVITRLSGVDGAPGETQVQTLDSGEVHSDGVQSGPSPEPPASVRPC